jgi:hypothetical protein
MSFNLNGDDLLEYEKQRPATQAVRFLNKDLKNATLKIVRIFKEKESDTEKYVHLYLDVISKVEYGTRLDVKYYDRGPVKLDNGKDMPSHRSLYRYVVVACGFVEDKAEIPPIIVSYFQPELLIGKIFTCDVVVKPKQDSDKFWYNLYSVRPVQEQSEEGIFQSDTHLLIAEEEPGDNPAESFKF